MVTLTRMAKFETVSVCKGRILRRHGVVLKSKLLEIRFISLELTWFIIICVITLHSNNQ